jgi:hypothetical protein
MDTTTNRGVKGSGSLNDQQTRLSEQQEAEQRPVETNEQSVGDVQEKSYFDAQHMADGDTGLGSNDPVKGRDAQQQ